MPKRNSTRVFAQGKPDKPYPDFPLFPHATKRWAKKIRGKMHYFGPWEEPDGALKKYLDQKDALQRGVTPVDTRDGPSVFSLCAKFLTAKKQLLENGELSRLSFAGYAAVCKRLVKTFGKSRLVRDLRPDDFAKLRRSMEKTWGPVRLKAEIVRSRVPFNYAYKSGLIDRPMVFGEEFRPPRKKTLRKHRAQQGPKMFTADELRKMLTGVSIVRTRRHLPSKQLKAMILLGINAGYGNGDVASLALSALDLENGWVNYARPKTGVDRRCPLWPETIEAIKDWLAVRPKPANDLHANLVFVTKRGSSWDGGVDGRPLSHEMRKFLNALGIAGHRNFYALRHTLQTIGDEARDFLAVRHIMGHVGADIADEYREKISDERLRAITDHVRGWLFTKAKRKVKGQDKKPAKASAEATPRLRLFTA